MDLYVSGAHNTGNVSIGSIPQNSYYLAGNPYIKTIDWDDVSKTSLSSVISVWDDATSSWKTWNGSSGDLRMDSLHHSKDFGYKLLVGLEVSLSRAMILQPVQAFIGRTTNEEQTGSLILSLSANNHIDRVYFTFKEVGQTYHDIADAEKLLPLNPRHD